MRGAPISRHARQQMFLRTAFAFGVTLILITFFLVQLNTKDPYGDGMENDDRTESSLNKNVNDDPMFQDDPDDELDEELEAEEEENVELLTSKVIATDLKKKNIIQPEIIWYNLLDENGNNTPLDERFECDLEYMSAKLEQDHDCVIDVIRKQFMIKSSHNQTLNFDNQNMSSLSTAILRLLHNQTGGFFVHYSTSVDGCASSNTFAHLEREFNWSGLVIQPNSQLIPSNRKVVTLPGCLSSEPSVTQVFGSLSNASNPEQSETCFPLYSILLAAKRTKVDFLNLAVNKSVQSLLVLKTIPWHKVEITTLAVEVDKTEANENLIIKFLEENGFIKFGIIKSDGGQDNLIFVQDFLRDLRY